MSAKSPEAMSAWRAARNEILKTAGWSAASGALLGLTAAFLVTGSRHKIWFCAAATAACTIKAHRAFLRLAGRLDDASWLLVNEAVRRSAKWSAIGGGAGGLGAVIGSGGEPAAGAIAAGVMSIGFLEAACHIFKTRQQLKDRPAQPAPAVRQARAHNFV
jgi:hypothetical protein